MNQPLLLVEEDTGRIIQATPGAQALYGMSGAELCTQRIADLLVRPLGEVIPARALHRLAGGLPREVELSPVPLEVAPGQRLLHLSLVSAGEGSGALRTSLLVAEAASRAKSDFVAYLSHELRNLIQVGMVSSSLLLSTGLNEEQQEYVQALRTSANAMQALVNDVLDLSKIEAGKLELEPRPFSVVDSIEQAVDLFSTQARSQGVTLALDFAGQLPAVLIADEGRLRQIVVNLLSNALKFTPAGEVRLTLSGSCRDEQCALRLEVRDTGIGIPAHRLAELFEPFVQAETSTARRYGGTGLGLALCKRLATAMGGELRATSEVGRGSSFALTLWCRAGLDPEPGRRELCGKRFFVAGPAPTAASLAALLRSLGAEADSGPPEVLRAQPREAGTILWAQPAPPYASEEARELPAELCATPRRAALYEALRRGPSSALRAVLIEPNPVNQRIAALLFSKMGAELYIANDEQEAASLLRGAPAALVLSSHEVPPPAGDPRPYFVALVSGELHTERPRRLAAGYDEVLPKPLRVDSLGALLRRWNPAPGSARG